MAYVARWQSAQPVVAAPGVAVVASELVHAPASLGALQCAPLSSFRASAAVLNVVQKSGSECAQLVERDLPELIDRRRRCMTMLMRSRSLVKKSYVACRICMETVAILTRDCRDVRA